MECNIEEIGGQIGESSSGEIVIRAHGKDEKEWQDWLQDFQLKLNLAWTVSNTFRHAAELHSGGIMFVNIIKLSTVANGGRIVCKAKLSVKVKLITANTRAKDKYIKVAMIYTYVSWLGALIIGLTETLSSR